MILHKNIGDIAPFKVSNLSVEDCIAANVHVEDDILEDLQDNPNVFLHYRYAPAKYTYFTIKRCLFYVENSKLALAMSKYSYKVTTNKNEYNRFRGPKTEQKLISGTELMDCILAEVGKVEWHITETDGDQVGVLDALNSHELKFNPAHNSLEQFLEENLIRKGEYTYVKGERS